ncbi:MAG: hypothetical protein GT600_05735 [Bacteroidales bacterium]|jgi:hypothetical protein|nr:hypothetical protein [Bacteroidales bacterium]NMD02838.1 hypothetical protein [Bacteroidales bacterium]OQB65479.1 MAG: hypothetical protein BWX96_00058 [Bacteroidetes bacterium ADurb.Bin145]HQK67618.1 hypothetical protein [Bacteroidales bacterium]
MRRPLCVLFLFLAAFLIQGCFAPLNSVFENATLPSKHELQVKASASTYYGPDFDLGEEDSKSLIHYNDNLGLALRFGFTDKFNLGLRYEHLFIRNEFELFDDNEPYRGKLNYFELSSKINLKKDKMALDIPVGLYDYEGEFIFAIDPRYIVTFRKSQKLEINLFPKIHIFIGDGIQFNPAIGAGLGLSSDLDKWAFRPEIGLDGNLFFGAGFTVNLNKKAADQ